MNDFCPSTGLPHEFINETISVPRWGRRDRDGFFVEPNEQITGRKVCGNCESIRVADPDKFSQFKSVVEDRENSTL